MKFLRRLRFLLQQRDLAEEMRVHQQMRADDGLDANRGFGNDLMLRERAREAWGWLWLDALGRDVRYALRLLRRSPGFAAMAVLSLAIGIGACTAVYSLVNAVFLQPLPVAHAQRLFTVYWAADRWQPPNSSSQVDFHLPDGRLADSTFSYPLWRAWQQDAASLAMMAGFYNLQLSVNVTGSPAERVEAMAVSGNFASVVGLGPVLGRSIADSDNRPGAPLVAEVSYAYWHARLDGRRNVIGQALVVDGLPATIIGVAPRAFVGLLPARHPDVYIPLWAMTSATALGPRIRLRAPSFGRPDWFWIEMIGRMRPGVTLARVRAALAVTFARTVAMIPRDPSEGTEQPQLLVVSARNGINANFYDRAPLFWMLGGLVALVFLVALANTANLMIARTAARQGELALRTAIGAGRGVLLAQMTIESLVMAVWAGVVAIPIAALIGRGLQAVFASELPIRLGLSALIITAVLAIGASAVLGLTATWRSSRMPAQGLREAHASPRAARNVTKVLLAAEVAICLLVLASAALFLRTVHNLDSVNTGFDAQNVTLLHVGPGRVGYSGARLGNFYSTLLDRLRALPGVEMASAVSNPPASGARDSTRDYGLTPTSKHNPRTYTETVAPGFFATYRIRLAGRDFTAADDATTPEVAIVNRSMARRFTGNPIGQKIYRGNEEALTIVGVAADTSYQSVQEPLVPILYRPLAQHLQHTPAITFVVRSRLAPSALVPRIRGLVASLGAAVPITAVETQQEAMAATYLPQQLLAYACTGLGLVVLLLAAIGLYGLMAYALVRRTREIGIRMALGATGLSVARLLSGELALVVGLGIAAGIAVTLVAGQALASLMFQLSPRDLGTLAGAALVLVLVAATAAVIPARRAARVDPVQAMRQE